MKAIHTRQIGRILIETFAYPEDLDPHDCFDTDDTDEICRRIDAGTLKWFCAEVRVSYGPYSASNYLGGCCYETIKDFITSGDYWSGMVREACVALRATIHRQAKLGAEWAARLSH